MFELNIPISKDNAKRFNAKPDKAIEKGRKALAAAIENVIAALSAGASHKWFSIDPVTGIVACSVRVSNKFVELPFKEAVEGKIYADDDKQSIEVYARIASINDDGGFADWFKPDPIKVGLFFGDDKPSGKGWSPERRAKQLATLAARTPAEKAAISAKMKASRQKA